MADLNLSKHTRDPKLDIPLIFSGRSHPQLAKEVAEHLGLEVSDCKWSEFASGDVKPVPVPTIRKRSVYVIQTATHDPDGVSVGEHLIDLLNLVDALKRASAAEICVVIPLMFGCRQDRKSGSHEPITAALYAGLLEEAGATAAVLVRLHSEQQQGFFSIPVDNIDTMPILIEKMREMGLVVGDRGIDNLCMVGTDAGEVRNTEKYANALQCDQAAVIKKRFADNQVRIVGIMGDVRGKICVLTDDMIDTGGSAAKAEKALMDNGAREVHFLCTHPLLNGEAPKTLGQSGFGSVIVTDTLPVPERKQFPGLDVVPISGFLASRIYERHTGETMRSLAESPFVLNTTNGTT